MKKQWDVKKLGEICDFEGGSQPPKSEFIYKEKHGYVRFLQIRDFASDNNVTFIPESKKNRLCKLSDIMIGRYGASVGKILTNKAGAYNVALMKTIPNLKILDPSWFYYYLISDTFQNRLLSVAARSAQNGFSKDDIYNFPVPVPPRQDQQRIVSILEEAFIAIATAKENAERNLQNTTILFDNHMEYIFNQRDNGWVEKRFSEVCGISSVLVDPRNSEYADMLHVGGANIESKTGRLVELKTAREEGLKSGKFIFDDTMVLYSKIRPYLMKIARPDFQGLCSADIYPLSVKTGQLNRNYLFYLLLSRGFTDYANAGSARAGMPKVNRDHLFAYRVHLPPIKKQERFAIIFDELATETQKLSNIYQQKLSDLEELKRSILHKAFTGELSGAN